MTFIATDYYYIYYQNCFCLTQMDILFLKKYISSYPFSFLALNSQTTLTLHHTGLEPVTLQTGIQLELLIEFISDKLNLKNTKQKEKHNNKYLINKLPVFLIFLYIYIQFNLFLIL